MIDVRKELGLENLTCEYKGNVYVEEWRDINGYEGLYQVSSFGRVKSSYFHKEKIMKSFTTKEGYRRISLNYLTSKSKYLIHRLVAQAFHLNPENKPEVNHIDEFKWNNFYLNLEWCTTKENCNHGTSSQRIAKALSRPLLKINPETLEIEEEFVSVREAGRQGYNHSQLVDCCNHKLVIHYGSLWSYKDNYSIEKMKKQQQRIPYFNVRGVLLGIDYKTKKIKKEYSDIKEVTKDGFSIRAVKYCLEEKNKTHKNLIWVLKDEYESKNFNIEKYKHCKLGRKKK